MKYLFYFFVACIAFILTSCEKNLNPLSNDDPNRPAIDWEGNYPLVNKECIDNILFASDRYLGTPYAPSVYSINKNGSGIKALTNQWFTFGASWSPRRWKIIFIADTSWGKPARGLYIMNSDGKEIKRLTPKNQDVFGTAAWSPNGNKIAYIEIDTTDQYSRGRVRVMNPDGTNSIVITSWFGSLTKVTWSPDSHKIIFGGFQYMSYDKLYIVNEDGSGLMELFNYPQGCYFPSWSPNGELLAFSSFAISGGIYYSKIFTFNFSTTHIQQITTGNTFDYHPTWSPDSKTILFSANLNGRGSIYSIDINGNNLTRITDSLGTDYDISWYN